MEELAGNIALVAGLTEAVKRAMGTRFSSERFGPILALLIGVGTFTGGTYAGVYEGNLAPSVVAGLISGLSASGLYKTVTAARS